MLSLSTVCVRPPLSPRWVGLGLEACEVEFRPQLGVEACGERRQWEMVAAGGGEWWERNVFSIVGCSKGPVCGCSGL